MPGEGSYMAVFYSLKREVLIPCVVCARIGEKTPIPVELRE